MAAQVAQVQKKEDGLLDNVMGTAMNMGKNYVTSKFGGAGAAASAAGGAKDSGGTGLGELINAGGAATQTSASNPRDRRMNRGF